MTNLKSNSSMLAKTPKRRVVSGEELEGSLGKVSGRTVGLHSHHPLVVWTRSELVEGGKKPANQKRRITAGRERAVTETAVSSGTGHFAFFLLLINCLIFDTGIYA